MSWRALSLVGLLLLAPHVALSNEPKFWLSNQTTSLATGPAAVSDAPSQPADDDTVASCCTTCRQSDCRSASCFDSDPICRLFPQDGALRVRGWLDAGYMYNTSNPASHFNGPYNAIDRDEGMFNQAYLILDRPLTPRNWIGGRVDLLYGFDYFLAQSLGFEAQPAGGPRWNSSQYYGFVLPQLYGEIGTQDFSVKLGHFYSIVGYEGVQSPTNFFYSHAYSYQFAGPFTHWGGIGTWNANSNWTVQGGLVNGWNTLDGQQDHASFMGGVKYTSDARDWWSSFAIITGQELNNPGSLPIPNVYANRTRYSLIFDRTLGNNWEYVFHHWFGTQAQGALDGGTAVWYGIDQYMYYRLNNWRRVGTRFEWFRDQDGTRVGLNRPSNPNKVPLPGSYYSWSVGENWTPWNNVVIRPELRWDFYDGPARPFDDGRKQYQLLLGFDVIWQY